MRIKKRNNTFEDFAPSKIERAIKLAFRSYNKAKDNADVIFERVMERIIDANEDEMTVEDIQNIIVSTLIEHNYIELAKLYIEYKEMRKRHQKSSMHTNHYLSKEFLSNYKHSPEPFNHLGATVFYRTYSRFIPEWGRREYWWEMIQRAVEYNASLGYTTKEDAELLYDVIFSQDGALAGRTFWTGGTPLSKKFPISQFNCAFMEADDISIFRDAPYLMMYVVGVGLGIRKASVDKLPPVRPIKIINKMFIPIPKEDRKEYTQIKQENKNTLEIVIGDSRFGWSMLFYYLFDIISSPFYNEIDTVIINYNNIRMRGEELKSFGGKASGYKVLADAINKIFNEIIIEPGKLTPIQIYDIMSIIGEAIVSGGTRRTGLLMLFDDNETSVYNAKKEMYTLEEGVFKANKKILHRRISNNTIAFDKKPSKERIKEIIYDAIVKHKSGEPALLNMQELQRRHPGATGINICGEILLKSKEFCNLVTINLANFIDDFKSTNPKEWEWGRLLNTAEALTKAAVRVNLTPIELPAWKDNMRRDNILGVSLGAVYDFFNGTGWYGSEVLEEEFLHTLREHIHNVANSYSELVGLPKPILTTTIKPSGTMSQLWGGVSAGIHPNYAPYYIRRVEIQKNDVIYETLKHLGYKLVDKNNEEDRVALVEFPVKAPKGITSQNITALELLNFNRFVMEHWTDNNNSITVYVADDEVDKVVDWIDSNWDSIVSITFLPKFDSYYPQLPYEAITQEEYEELSKHYENVTKINALELAEFEKEETEIDFTNDECSTGACPIR